jgi:hypothetical protein
MYLYICIFSMNHLDAVVWPNGSDALLEKKIALRANTPVPPDLAPGVQKFKTLANLPRPGWS